MDILKKEDGSSLNIMDENIKALKDILPDAFTEEGVDFDVLRQLLGDDIVDGEEKYGLNWRGKKRARQTALTPSVGTLRPCHDESIGWDTTQNLFLEGDNLEILKLLRRSYANKVKMIYIDPPYNTGNEFIYPDKYKENLETYLLYTGQKGDDGFKLTSNAESSGRYHTNWLNMMYARLHVAKNLLSDEGIIFISIDDHELANLLSICREIFGEENYIGTVSRATGTRMGSGSRGIARELDYFVIFSKKVTQHLHKLPMTERQEAIYDREDERGKYLIRSLRRTGGEDRREDRPSMYYAVLSPDGEEIYPMGPEGYESRWMCSRKNYERLVKGGMIEWRKVTHDGVNKWQVYKKHYLSNNGRDSSDFWGDGEGNKKATKDLKALFDSVRVFDHPKPLEFSRNIVQLGTTGKDNEIILDFFAGSATLAHAVYQQNVIDGGNRRYIMIQLPEECATGTNAFNSGYINIADLGKERIRRVVSKIESESPNFDGDLGFRVFKLDSSNIRAWNPDVSDLEQTLLDHAEHLVEGRSEQDVLYELLLIRGVDLSVPIKKKKIAGKAVYSIGYGVLFACLNETIDKSEIESIGRGIIDWHKELEPASDTHVVFRDSAFANDIAKTNMTAILEQNCIAHVRSL